MKMLNEFVKKTSEEIDSLNEDVEEIKLQKEKNYTKKAQSPSWKIRRTVF